MATAQEALLYNKNHIHQGAGFEILANTSIVAAVTLTGNEARRLLIDTTGGAFTITLSATPYVGMKYEFVDAAATGSFGANNLTISGNGKTINGANTLVLNANFASRALEYVGSSWIVSSRGVA